MSETPRLYFAITDPSGVTATGSAQTIEVTEGPFHPESVADAPVGNYYGGPYVRRDGDAFMIGVSGPDGEETEVSERFFNAFVDEFGSIEP